MLPQNPPPESLNESEDSIMAYIRCIDQEEDYYQAEAMLDALGRKLDWERGVSPSVQQAYDRLLIDILMTKRKWDTTPDPSETGTPLPSS